ncbi:hypothetical protein [Enterococcus sp. BWR-S5]|uniref:hypothetical protein n=1 Tax=Enterococcus sp. BWR-S5 TaxID=2787714 RepID=UPI001924DEB1|nr:hypothetical protein [Enterococcus sp. BWR-S5]MBL1226608.1 hypothetical protein [Enterococcus sp. BWR-S5]
MSSSDEVLTVDSFLFICKEIGLSFAELEIMDIGQCLDYVQQWIDEKTAEINPAGTPSVRKAGQTDFDSF